MLEITPHANRSVNPSLPGPVQSEAPKVQAPAAQPAQSDQVELSEAARTYQAEHAESAADARIRDLRARIAADDYITDEMLDYVVDRLHEELFGKA